uniref:Myomodulin 1 n=1 Tax=Deroceras reticulatum TaxID=145610 RepID=A0A1X9WEF0_DERRE|nr:myomodulin 1 [Deroceras reticulatum]
MHRRGLISLAVAVCLQLSLGYADNDASKANSDSSQDASLSRAKRGGYDMLRLGRGLNMLRLGKRMYDSTSDLNENTPSNWADLQDYVEHDPENVGFDYSTFPESLEDSIIQAQEGKYGKDLVDMGKRKMSMLRLGKRSVDNFDEDASAHFRQRRSASSVGGAVASEVLQSTNQASKDLEPVDLKDEDDDELLVEYPNDISQSEEDIDGKEWLPVISMGKRQLSMLRLGKRSLGMLRLGKRESEDDEEKRALGMLRLGKRQLSMLRLGKRSLGMLRLGKRPSDDLDEVYGDEDDLTSEDGKRAMSMLRLGKRPMSMLRLGKRDDEEKRDMSKRSAL